MTAEQFAYWMQGFTELTAGEMPSATQWTMMKEHLATVFIKVTPPLRVAPNGPYPHVPYDWCPMPGSERSPLIAICSSESGALTTC